MAQILCMGASTVYGVGGPNGGWADMIKRDLHMQMYGETQLGEVHEVYIFAKPDATTDFILRNYQHYLTEYRRDGRPTIVVLSIGFNNAKAINTPDGYISSPADYQANIRHLLELLSAKVDSVICVGFTPVDESKTAPKLNPFTNKYSYFINHRIKQFNDAFRQAAQEAGDKVQFVDLFGAAFRSDWVETCLSPDGLHPNDKGHRWIYNRVMPAVTDTVLNGK